MTPSTLDEPQPAAERGRVAWLDAARCLAIVLMVFAHVRDQLLSADLVGVGFDHWYGKTRGITAPLFFIVGGMAFAAATLHRSQDYQRWSQASKERLLRIVALFCWGYLLTLPWWAEGFPFQAPALVWKPFLTFGVLHTIATAMVVCHLLMLAGGGPYRFAALALLFSLATIVIAPWLQTWASALGAAARGPLNGDGMPGGFPLAPHAAFFCFGAALGAMVLQTRGATRRFGLAAVGGGLALVALGKALHPVVLGTLGELRFWQSSPTLFLTRGGAALVIIGAFAALVPRSLSLPPLMATAARHALTFYVGHMLLLWGTPWLAGLVHRLGQSLSVAGVAALAGACLAGILCWCWLAERVRFWWAQAKTISPSWGPSTAVVAVDRSIPREGKTP
jgi:uncharacterized membrane protein